MKPFSKLLIASLAALALVLPSDAASVSWGSWTEVADNTAIQTLGGLSAIGPVVFDSPPGRLHGFGNLFKVWTSCSRNISCRCWPVRFNSGGH